MCVRVRVRCVCMRVCVCVCVALTCRQGLNKGAIIGGVIGGVAGAIGAQKTGTEAEIAAGTVLPATVRTAFTYSGR